ncbi:class I SAM-dependent methyltransferase [Candidatus Amesbacteria bacterium]|nr:class I SAM-dependent methyltransferase [Candidatus Amesbacteria bacterium]
MYQEGVTPWKGHPPEPTLSRFLEYLKKKRPQAKVLDIGCGDGWISIQAAKLSFDVWGIDGARTAIDSAREAAVEEGVQDKTHFRVGDALTLPYETDFFDALIDRGLFHHILPLNRFLYMDNIVRVLKKTSFIYLSVFSMKSPEGIGQRFTRGKIEDLFDQHFAIDHFADGPYPTDAPAHLLHFILRRK